MSLPAQNLHDFVLSLLTDDAARSAFEADPTAALANAGLSDVTPQDIQEVAPLVADYAPSLASLATAAPDLGALPIATPDLSALPLSTPDLANLTNVTSDLGSLPAVGDL
ncbi:MAG TPA: IniB N-terminal domain-containing protein, partial [Amycolatopsis sp.]|nr:IniB N-terminal domain-containing protein [Amycolatopsis sp.]